MSDCSLDLSGSLGGLSLGGCDLLWGHLLLLLLKHVLLQQAVRLVSLGIEVVKVSDKLERIDNLIVIEEHTSDLASVVSVLLLDDWIDTVSDFLPALLLILDLAKLLEINECGLLLNL